MQDFYSECRQCPRSCGINRKNSSGFCGETEDLRIAFAGLHFGEEPLITVFGGSGTIFFTGCTLRCSFCQNYQISQNGLGRAVNKEEFLEICLKLKKKGAENINLVTGSHHIPKIAEFIRFAKKQGFDLPFCWNSSGYETVEMLELLKGLVTIWLPDLKTLNADFSKDLFGAPDYPSAAVKAIEWMIENNPLEIVEIEEPENAKPVEWAEPGEPRDKMLSGVIIRHLYMPGHFEDTAQVLDWYKQNGDKKAILSLMNQYTPVKFDEEEAKLKQREKSLSKIENRLVNQMEFEDLQDLLEVYDFDFLFYQELTDDTSWLPDFNRKQPFSNALATPVWHFKG